MKHYLIIKRVLDWVTAFMLLILTSPIIIIAGISIMLSSKGSVFFCQKRPGINEKIFTVYKLRTMSMERDSEGRLLPDNLRVNRVGAFLRKSSIDELPQLINILKGDMSFIGPRPLLVQYLDHYTAEQNRRHSVLPGISGWAQVNGRNAISWEEKFQYDVWYVDHISFLLDLKIVVKTIKNVFVSDGINNSQNETMPIFSGKTLDGF